MKNTTKRLISAFLLLAVASSAAACAESGSAEKESGVSGQTEAVTEAETKELTELEKRKFLKDSLPETTFGGKEFRITTRENWSRTEVYTEEQNGEILNDALFERNRTVEERFDVKIVPLDVNPDNHLSVIRSSVQSGENDFELINSLCYQTGTLVTEGMLYNLLELPHTDFSQPWWINGINDNYRIGDGIFVAVGDMCVSTLTLTYAFYYNRTLGANWDFDFETDIYNKVKDGTWTIDYVTEMVHDVYSDVNGDSQRDTGDIYGFTAESATNLDVYPFAFNIHMIEKNADGMPEIIFNSPKTIEAVEKVSRLYWDGVGSYIATQDYGESTVLFRNCKALFSTIPLSAAFNTLRDMADEYTILPYPKYEEAQEKYMTGTMDQHSVLSVPCTITDPEFVSVIMEAINLESYKTLFPTYYEEALQNKYARDEYTIEMLDILMQGRNFDFATLFASQLNNLTWIFREVVAGKKMDFASKYKTIDKPANKSLEKILKAYEDQIG